MSDRKFGVSSAGSSLIDHYEPHIVTAQDYYPFGMLSRVALPGNDKSYAFGFNGKMNDNEVKGGLGNQQDYGMRGYDPRVGRLLSVDPLTQKFPELTPYQFASNRPIDGVDFLGLQYFRPAPSAPVRPTLRIIRGGGKGGAYTPPPMEIVRTTPDGTPFSTTGIDLNIPDANGGNDVIIRSEAAVKLDFSKDKMPWHLLPEINEERKTGDAGKRFEETIQISIKGFSNKNQFWPQALAQNEVSSNLQASAALLTKYGGKGSGSPLINHEQYALRAKSAGLYPIFVWGEENPVGSKYLKQGEVWKFGTTVDAKQRYTAAWLERMKLDYKREFTGTEEQVLIIEAMKIMNYQFQNSGQLPPGNKMVK